jgi:hypothetical protein
MSSLRKPLALVLRASLVLAFVSAGAALTGCKTVAPYERAKLAHPTMAATDEVGFGEAHLRALSEGATGGGSGNGSGCGCN